MSIQTYKLKNGQIRHRVNVKVGHKLDGTLDQRTKVCKTVREAKRVHSEFEALKQTLNGRSDRMSFKEFVELYYLPMKRKALRRTTLRSYEGVIKNHLMPTLAGVAVCDINRLQIQTLISSKATYKVAKNTRDMLRQILGEASQLELIRSNPASGRFRLPDKKDTDQSRTGECVSSIDEHKRMIELANDDVRPILVLGLCFGLRKGEILGLDWQDIDLNARTITVRQTYTHAKGKPEITAPKTEKSRRTIPMSSFAYGQLKKLQGSIPKIGAVCVYLGERMTPHQARDIMQRYTKSNDAPKVTILSLRHSFATAAIRSGVPVELVSKALGHTTITTTYNRYVRPLQDDLDDLVQIMDKAYGGV